MRPLNDANEVLRSKDEIDDGGWVLGQVIVWITTRRLPDAQSVATKEGYWAYKMYQSAHDPNFPKRREGESDSEVLNRISEYHRIRLASEIPALKQARFDMLQSLRRGRLFALDKHGEKVDPLKWQVFDLSSDEVASFRYPSGLVQKQWRPLEVKRTRKQADVNDWVVARLKDAQASGKRPPKQLSLVSEGQSEIGASVRQLKLAIRQAPSTLRNVRGRPKQK